MFRHLVDASAGCATERYEVDLKEFADLARAHDAAIANSANATVPKALHMGGVVFHESRCGSTLVANALMAMSPTRHRVYSESPPPIAAIKTTCGDDFQFCSMQQAAALLRDVMYLMSRTNDEREERVFFKIQSVGSRHLQVFQMAFPEVPWMFVYRDPVQVMMSQLAPGLKNSNCVRGRNRAPTAVSDVLLSRGKNAHDASPELYCAAHLASITQSAVAALDRDPERGTAVNYVDLPQALYEYVLPQRMGLPVSEREAQRIQEISGVYSKGVGKRHGEFHEDSKKKEAAASKEVRLAAKLLLQKSFDQLESRQQSQKQKR